ncbi:hypothetical protein EZV62_003631 [Acer yangbiense]|uniref:Jacalin-type lectin domain-containing protein n=1 Tax=Acer yangbiense TaxID=1000413 RepID=A0A5C7IJS3_9ROSI|nr:hypothetical protein EZV62_003631 [Acer yangbiense]
MEGGKDKNKKSIVGDHGVEMVGPAGMMGPTMGSEKSHLFMIVASTPSVWCMIRTVSLSHRKNMVVLVAIGRLRIRHIKLQYPEEFLISVSGHYCPVVHGGSPVVRSLAFKSNKRTLDLLELKKEPLSLSQWMEGWLLDSKEEVVGILMQLASICLRNNPQSSSRGFREGCRGCEHDFAIISIQGCLKKPERLQRLIAIESCSLICNNYLWTNS